MHQISFDAQDTRGRQKRFVVVLGFTAILLAGAFFFVRINPACRQNLAVHHAQYQELAEALSEGKVSVGDAEEALLAMKNPMIPSHCSGGNRLSGGLCLSQREILCVFRDCPSAAIVFALLSADEGALQNLCGGICLFCRFIIAAAGFVYELMKRYFKEQPFICGR